MVKRFVCAALAVIMTFALASCGKTKILHCDNCNAEVTVSEKSNMTEEWTLYCASCEEQLGMDTLPQ